MQQPIYASTDSEYSYLKSIYRSVVLEPSTQRVYVTKIDKNRFKTRFIVRGDYYIEFTPGNRFFDVYIHSEMPQKEMQRLMNQLCQYLKVKRNMKLHKRATPFMIYRQGINADGLPMKLSNYFLLTLDPSMREIVRNQMMRAVMPFTD